MVRSTKYMPIPKKMLLFLFLIFIKMTPRTDISSDESYPNYSMNIIYKDIKVHFPLVSE